MATTTKQTLYNNETGFSKAIQDYYNEGIISFTFGGIKTHLNKNGEEKKDLIKMTKLETINADNFKDFCMIEHKGLAIITGKLVELLELILIQLMNTIVCYKIILI
jgi:hypothetical protein